MPEMCRRVGQMNRRRSPAAGRQAGQVGPARVLERVELLQRVVEVASPGLEVGPPLIDLGEPDKPKPPMDVRALYDVVRPDAKGAVRVDFAGASAGAGVPVNANGNGNVGAGLRDWRVSNEVAL